MFIKFRLKDMGTTYSNCVTSDTLQFNNGYTLSFTATALSDTSIRLTWYPGEITTANPESVGIWYRNDAFPDSALDPAAAYVGSYALADSADTLEGLDFASMYYYFLSVKNSAGDWSGFPDIGRDSAMTLDTNETMVFVDDFEHQAIDAPPADWQIDSLSGTVDITENGITTWGGRNAEMVGGGSNNVGIIQDFAVEIDRGIYVLEWDMQRGETDENTYLIVYGDPYEQLVNLAFGAAGVITSGTNSGGSEYLTTYDTSASHYKVVYDMQRYTYDFYKDGVLVKQPFCKQAYRAIHGINCLTAHAGGTVRLDNVAVYARDCGYDPDTLSHNFSAIALSDTSIRLSWYPKVFGDDAARVGVWYDTTGYPDSANDPDADSITFGLNDSVAILSAMKPGHAYYFLLAVKDSSGNWTGAGDAAYDSAVCLDTNETMLFADDFEHQEIYGTPDGFTVIDDDYGYTQVIDWEQHPEWGRNCVQLSQTLSGVEIRKTVTEVDDDVFVMEWSQRRGETNKKSYVRFFNTAGEQTIGIMFDNGFIANYYSSYSSTGITYGTEPVTYRIEYDFRNYYYRFYRDGVYQASLVCTNPFNSIGRIQFLSGGNSNENYADVYIDNVRMYRRNTYYPQATFAQGFNVTPLSSAEIRMTWYPGLMGTADAESIGVCYKTGGYPAGVTDASGQYLSYALADSVDTLSGLAGDSTYYFLSAVKDSGGTWHYGDDSGTDSARTLDTNAAMCLVDDFEHQGLYGQPADWSISGYGFNGVVGWEHNAAWGGRAVQVSQLNALQNNINTKFEEATDGTLVVEWDYRKGTMTRSAVYLEDSTAATAVYVYFERTGDIKCTDGTVMYDTGEDYDSTVNHFKVVADLEGDDYSFYINDMSTPVVTYERYSPSTAIARIRFKNIENTSVFGDTYIDNVMVYRTNGGGGSPKRAQGNPVVRLELSRNASPNPFFSTTNIEYVVRAEHLTRTTVRIYNSTGRFMTELYSGYQFPGTYNVTWSGRRDDGGRIDDGVYFYEVVTGDTRQVGVLMRMGN